MNILTTRFGLIQACETDLILVPEGLLGFRSFTHYVHLARSGCERSVLVAERDRAGTGIWTGRAALGGQRLPDRAPPGRPGGTGAGRRTVWQ